MILTNNGFSIKLNLIIGLLSYYNLVCFIDVTIYFTSLQPHKHRKTLNRVYCLGYFFTMVRRYGIIYDLTLHYFLLKSNPRI